MFLFIFSLYFSMHSIADEAVTPSGIDNSKTLQIKISKACTYGYSPGPYELRISVEHFLFDRKLKKIIHSRKQNIGKWPFSKFDTNKEKTPGSSSLKLNSLKLAPSIYKNEYDFTNFDINLPSLELNSTIIEHGHKLFIPRGSPSKPQKNALHVLGLNLSVVDMSTGVTIQTSKVGFPAPNLVYGDPLTDDITSSGNNLKIDDLWPKSAVLHSSSGGFSSRSSKMVGNENNPECSNNNFLKFKMELKDIKSNDALEAAPQKVQQ